MEKVKITQLTDRQGDSIYPLTHAKAVVFSDGTRLDAILAEVLRRLDELEEKTKNG